MFRSIEVSTSGLVAHRQWMTTIAGNIANVNTTRDENGKPAPFQRRIVTFQAQESGARGEHDAAEVASRVEMDEATQPLRIYQPGHPDADKDGFVLTPNINMMNEFVNAMHASRGYEANVSAMEMAKEMLMASLRILQ